MQTVLNFKHTPDTITLDHRSEIFKISQDTIWDVNIYMIFIRKLIPLGRRTRNYLEACSNEGPIYFFFFDITAVDFFENLNACI